MNKLGGARAPFLFITDFELQKISIVPLEQLDNNIAFNLNGTQYGSPSCTSKDIMLEIEPFPKEDYTKAFHMVMDHINYGNTFLLNLTARHKITNTINLKEIYDTAQAKYKLLLNDKLVVFSPECFVRIQDGTIYSYPMKGTIDANLPKAAELLLSDQKERAEHNTIIDLIRNDLSIYAKNVKVTKYRYLDLIQSQQKSLYQLSSEISGQLPKNYHKLLGDIIFSMLPAGSISGAPKKKTIEIINDSEANKRGYYTGVCGYFDGSNLDSFVMIRFIEKEQDNFYYRSGGGITFQSELKKEYQEMIDKIYIPVNQMSYDA